MKIFQNASIKRKQVFIIMLTTSVALLLACAAFAVYEVISFRATMLRALTTMAQIIGDNCAASIDFNDAKSAKENLAALKHAPNIVAACVYSKDGKVLAMYDRPNHGRIVEPPKFQPGGYHYGKHDLVLFNPINYKGDTIGVVYIAADMEALYSRLRQYAVIDGMVLLITLVASFFLSARLQEIISAPIRELVSTAYAVARDRNYSLRAIKRNQDELGVLTDGFNDMLAQIQARDADLQKAHDQQENRVEERTQELATSLSLLNATLESTTDGIVAVDLSGRIVSYNTKFADLWDFPPGLLESRNVAETRAYAAESVKDPKAFLRSIEDLQTGKETGAFDVVELKDGRTFERYIFPQRIGAKCVGTVINYRDITERKQSEEELRGKTALLEAQANSTLDGLLVVDDEGNKLFCNQRFAKVWKIPQHIVEQHDDEVILKYAVSVTKDPEQFHERVRHLYAHPDEIGWDEVELKDGTILDRYSSPVLGRDGTHYGRIWVFRDVTERKRSEAELEAAHRQLIDTSRQAGMAEVATSVLHNVGNVLNSVNISSTVISDKVKSSKVVNLAKAVALIEMEKHDVGRFFAEDPKGRQLPAYLSNLALHLSEEREEILQELALLVGNIEHIKEIVTMQQSYARVSGVLDHHKIVDLMEDALRMNAGAMDRHEVKVIRDYQQSPVALVDKHKVMQILVNLIRNAKYALDDGKPPVKQMTLRVTANGDERVKVAVIDNGVGIPAENLTRIFGHGFTTRKEGHGFGLHSGALAARELGGALTVESDGPGKGATFILEFPIQPAVESIS